MFKAFGKDGWVDERIEIADWAELKPTTPLGYLPLLTLPDGSVVSQTDAMMRWAGRQSKLYPEDVTQGLFVDEITHTVIECLGKTPPAAGDEGKAMRTEYANEGLLKKCCTLLESKLGDGGFFVGGELTLADMTASVLVNMIVTDDYTHVPPTYMDAFPKLRANHEAVRKHPTVVAYLAEYPN